MKRIGFASVAVLAILVLNTLGAQSASAFVGPLCVKVDEGEQGFWTNGNCNVAGAPREYINATLLFPINRGLWCARIDSQSEKIVGGVWFVNTDCTGAKTEAGEHIKVLVPEGPWYRTEGKDLAAGETRLLLASPKTNFLLEDTVLGQTITCTGFSLPDSAHMQIQGSSAGNPGTSNEIIDFTGCTQTGNGTPCTITNSLISTVPVLNLLGYSTSARSGPVLVLFEPEAGKVFTTIKYTGTGCKVTSQAVTGTVIGLAQVGGGQVGVVGNTETLHGEVAFHKAAKSIFIEKEGVVGAEVKAKLELAGTTSSLTGTALLAVDLVLANGTLDPVIWGVFTQI